MAQVADTQFGVVRLKYAVNNQLEAPKTEDVATNADRAGVVWVRCHRNKFTTQKPLVQLLVGVLNKKGPGQAMSRPSQGHSQHA